MGIKIVVGGVTRGLNAGTPVQQGIAHAWPRLHWLGRHETILAAGGFTIGYALIDKYSRTLAAANLSG